MDNQLTKKEIETIGQNRWTNNGSRMAWPLLSFVAGAILGLILTSTVWTKGAASRVVPIIFLLPGAIWFFWTLVKAVRVGKSFREEWERKFGKLPDKL